MTKRRLGDITGLFGTGFQTIIYLQFMRKKVDRSRPSAGATNYPRILGCPEVNGITMVISKTCQITVHDTNSDMADIEVPKVSGWQSSDRVNNGISQEGVMEVVV